MSTVANLVEAPVLRPRPIPPTSEFVRRLFAPRPPKEERRTIACPNRHASLPCPARERVASILRDLSGELALLGVTAIGLFGSVARGDDTPGSDVDVAALFADEDFTTRRVVNNFLEVHFNRHVDMVRLPLHHPLSVMASDDLIMVW